MAALDEELRIAERSAQAIGSFKASSAANSSQLISDFAAGLDSCNTGRVRAKGIAPQLSTHRDRFCIPRSD